MTQQGDTTDRSRRRGRGIIIGLVVVLLVAGAYAATVLWADGKLPSDTRIGGVAVGGLSEDAAQQRLEKRLADEEQRPVTVKAGSKTVRLDPQQAGLSYDYEESVAGLTGFSANPVDLVKRAVGGSEHPIRTDVDRGALDKAIARAAAKVDRKPVDGTVTLKGTDIDASKARSGRSVDQQELAEQVEDGWPQERTYTAPSKRVEADITQSEVDAFVDQDLEPLLSGPITVHSTDPTAKGDKAEISFEVTPKQLVDAVSVRSTKGELQARIDDKKLVQAVEVAAEKSDEFVLARDASVSWEGGDDYRVRPSAKGFGLQTKGMADTVSEAMTHRGAKERTVTIDSKVTTADFTTKQARKTLPKEEISTFTTHLTDDAERTENIDIAARRLDGTYVKPGETFSLNARLGERTGAKGYNAAPVIENGRLVNDYGGGISQLSTTLFNAVFFSGAKIEEFHPHSWYISRYPEGREATISWPTVDQKFTNDTGAGILIKAHVEGDDVTVTFHGRAPYDDVKAEKSPRRNIVEPEHIVDDSADCVSQSPTPGFDVTVERKFINDGEVVKTSDFFTHYVPEDEVVCTG